jgi:hypothetical protein
MDAHSFFWNKQLRRQALVWGRHPRACAFGVPASAGSLSLRLMWPNRRRPCAFGVPPSGGPLLPLWHSRPRLCPLLPLLSTQHSALSTVFVAQPPPAVRVRSSGFSRVFLAVVAQPPRLWPLLPFLSTQHSALSTVFVAQPPSAAAASRPSSAPPGAAGNSPGRKSWVPCAPISSFFILVCISPARGDRAYRDQPQAEGGRHVR